MAPVSRVFRPSESAIPQVVVVVLAAVVWPWLMLVMHPYYAGLSSHAMGAKCWYRWEHSGAATGAVDLFSDV